MELNHLSRLSIVLLLVTATAPISASQAQRSTYDPASQNQSSKPRKGFVDFTLGRINPSDKDYGQCIAEGRKLVVQETLKNGYFWSNVAALGLLGCLFIIILYQHKIQMKRGWATAEMLAEYEHALARANAQVDEATDKNHAIMEALTTLKEAALRSPMLSPEMVEAGTAPVKRSPTKSIPNTQVSPSNGATKPVNGRVQTTTAAAGSANQMGLFKHEVDLVMQVNSLEQQLVRSKEETQQLRRQLSDSDRRLRDEHQKNRALKGG